jgi:transposase-like protein
MMLHEVDLKTKLPSIELKGVLEVCVYKWDRNVITLYRKTHQSGCWVIERIEKILMFEYLLRIFCQSSG